MVEPISLNRVRKIRAKAEGAAEAKINRIRFGRTKIEKAVEKAADQKSLRDHAGRKREP